MIALKQPLLLAIKLSLITEGFVLKPKDVCTSLTHRISRCVKIADSWGVT